MNIVKNLWDTWGPAISDQDCYSAVYPVTYFLRIVGMFPLSLKGSVGGRKYSTCYASLMYSAVVCVSMMTSFAMLEPSKSAQMFQRSNLTRINMRVYELLQIPLVFVTFATIVFAREKIANTLNNLCDQNEALQKLGIRFDYAAEFKRSFIRLGMIVSTIVALSIRDFFSLFEYNLHHPLIWMTWAVVRFGRIMVTCLYAELILVLEQKFIAINEDLKRIIGKTKDSPLQTVSMQLRTEERIRSIARIYDVLYESASHLNRIFGIRMIIGVILALLSLTTNVYYVVREIQNPNRSLFKTTDPVIRGIFGSVDTVYILWACTGAQNQATLTGKLIHKLNVNGADTVLHTAIQNFSLQLDHEKLAFSGAGLFPLDATLIQSIVGAVTTYLVIMLQFDTVTS